MMRAVVVGASGFVGRRLVDLLGARGVGTYHRHGFPGGSAFDATQQRFADLRAGLAGDFTHAIVLYGAIDVEQIARDPAGTAKVNIDSVWRVIEDVLAAGMVPMFVSTDYVFDGTRPGWRESDAAHPCTQYGAQKLVIEQRLAAVAEPWMTVRLSRVVGRDPATHSVLGPWVNELRAGKTMRCATDQIFSPVFVDDAAAVMIRLCEIGARGLYHLGGPEPFSRIGLLRLLADAISKVAPAVHSDITPCSLHDLPFLERRPLDTSLNIDKVQALLGWSFKPMAALCAEVAAAQFGGARQDEGRDAP